VARRYRGSPATVAQWNKTTAGASFKAGQSIVVFVQPRAAKAPVRSSAKKARAIPIRKPAPKPARKR